VAPLADDPLLSVAASISEGDPVDWDRMESDQTIDTDVLEQLRVLDRIAQLHASRSSWGSLTIVEPLGHGTFGDVYRAFDTDLHRDVALKVTRAVGPGHAFDADRLVREARLLARVRHPNVVTVFSAERKDDEVGVSMELVKGRTLDEVVRANGPLSAREVALIGIDLCKALAAVHAAGLLHGDIKAHNVMREDGGRIVLMDFGASRDLTRSPNATGDDFAGTPLYVAPEVFAGQPRSRASDIYSLGVLLYYLATATYPVPGDTRTAITRQHEQQAPRRHLRDVRPDLPDAFIDAVEGGLAINPGARYASVGAFEAALNGTLHESSRRSAIAIGSIAAGVVLIGALVGSAVYSRLSGSARVNTNSAVATTPAAATPSPALAPSAANYEVGATMYRVDGDAVSPLRPGERLNPGDKLYLQVKTSVAAHVYIVNEDDRGESYLLFPLPNQSLQNPLPGGRDNRLPGVRDGREMYWQVTSAGGREHFLIFVSPEPLKEFERTFASLALPNTNEPVLSARLSERAVGVLRGVGGLVAGPPRAEEPATLSARFETPLASGPETTSGTWVRQVTFANP
jgi:eukaryotic-like serine/threonine-protein kinase